METDNHVGNESNVRSMLEFYTVIVVDFWVGYQKWGILCQLN